MSYLTLSSQEKHIFLLCSYFHFQLAYIQWWKPGAEFGGMKNISADPRFVNDVFGGKNFHFRGKKLFFLVIDQIFQIFPFFSQIFPVFAMLNVIFHPFLTRKTHFLTLFILSRESDNTTSLNIGGTNAWASPHLKFLGGDRPPSPPRSPPMLTYETYPHFK